MSRKDYIVRPVQSDDDFELIERLYYRTNFEKKSGLSQGIPYRATNWKELLFPELAESTSTYLPLLRQLSNTMFVALQEDRICAFAMIGISTQTHNGYLEYGHEDDCEGTLSFLLNQCEDLVRTDGGTRLYKGTNMRLGQIRNADISTLEGHGFLCNSYYHIFAQHKSLTDWNPPDDLELNLIEVVPAFEYQTINSILEQDNEFFLAEEFRSNFSSHSPDHVFLCLRSSDGERIGIAYYKVWENKGSFVATAFGVHFRPDYSVTRKDVRRFILATLLSMKQIGISLAWSRVSSQNFDAILELSAEGFEISPTHTVMMVKPI